MLMFQPDKLLHEGVAEVGSVRAAMAVEHREVQQVVMDTGDTEAVLVLLPVTQNRRTAHARQTDLRGRRFIISPTIYLSLMYSFIHLSNCVANNSFIHSFIHCIH